MILQKIYKKIFYLNINRKSCIFYKVCSFNDDFCKKYGIDKNFYLI